MPGESPLIWVPLRAAVRPGRPAGLRAPLQAFSSLFVSAMPVPYPFLASSGIFPYWSLFLSRGRAGSSRARSLPVPVTAPFLSSTAGQFDRAACVCARRVLSLTGARVRPRCCSVAPPQPSWCSASEYPPLPLPPGPADFSEAGRPLQLSRRVSPTRAPRFSYLSCRSPCSASMDFSRSLEPRDAKSATQAVSGTG
ncbi:hypothetical protein NDU88_004969 [Pleurodeles waltl]|uniref:Uncharacterized protein n=1 Tax=Pleurodeles waltl TaxID=8319 RepID=A0AAV7LLJ4_PLEWA|nr:hypothetical protein NDU88_004969 [Pleurodeles waltl]